MPHATRRSRGTGSSGGKQRIWLVECDFRENGKAHQDTVYTDMCAFSHTTLSRLERAPWRVWARPASALRLARPRPSSLQPPHTPHARYLLPGGAPSHTVEARCVEAHCVGGMVGERLLRARPLRRAREAHWSAHWSAPCLGSLQRKRSLAMRMRRSFMSSFSFSKSNWPRSISGEEIGGRICSGSSSK